MQPISQNAHESAPVSEGSPLPAPSLADTPTTACTPEQESASQILAADLTVATVPSLAHAPQPPGHFGPYVLLQEIARGGMGVVFRARHEVLGRDVALKTIQSAHQVKPELVTRFYQEAQAVAQLKHPNIIQIYDFGIIEGRHYFTMALAQGSLLSKLAHYQADQHAAVAVIEKVARAVQHVHESGLLHRDLKPGNILLDQGEPLVSDFGLAKSLELELELTRTGSAIGTPAYMAPEQAAGRGDQVCPQTDVWSLGVILYELLCGKKPFGGGSREEVIRAIQEDDPASPRSLQPRLDRNLEAILQKCLEKEAKRRYGSAAALADDLGAWLRGEPIRARPLGWLGKTRRSFRKHRYRVIAAAVLLLAPVAYMIVSDRLDESRGLRQIQKEQEQNAPVTLIGAMANPRWYQWRLGGEAVPASKTRNFMIKSTRFALCELLPSPTWKGFRLKADVRHELTGLPGHCGIYFAHDVQRRGERDFQNFISLTLADNGGYVRNGIGMLDYRVFLHHRPDVGPFENILLERRPIAKFPAASAARTPQWRQLGLEATSKEIRVSWDGAMMLKLPRQKIEALAPAALEYGVPAGFSVMGGLGIYVNNGEASFRNVVIEPFDN